MMNSVRSINFGLLLMQQDAIGATVAGRRLLETLCRPHAAASRRATVQPPPPATSLPKEQLSSSLPIPHSNGQEDSVIGVLTSLLQQQQQPLQGNGILAGKQQQQQQDIPSAATTTLQAAVELEWASASSSTATSSQLLSAETCQPEVAAAASSGVRMESQLVFDSCWRRFKDRRGLDFAAPREIVWLNGAPGSGKGVSAPHIQKVRGMTRSVCISSLISNAPEAQRYIAAGEMISDATVGDLLLEELLPPGSAGLSTADINAVVDGFPRTAVQVDFVKLLLDKLMRLHRKYVDTPLASRFPRPAFKVVVLYVDEGMSIQRQLQRAVAARAHNMRVKDAGVGEQALHEERPTDLDLNKATKRYQIFKQHYSAILRLKQFLPFHLIDAMGSKQDTQEQITQELRYQSSLDLSEEAYNAIRHLPLAQDLQQTARQQLVGRLETYCSQQRPLFGRVLAILQDQVLPVLQQGALSGSAEWVSQESLFSQHPMCVDMLLDVLSDRGFKAMYCKETVAVPVSMDAASGTITVRSQLQHRFKFSLEQAGEREASMLKALEIAARITEAARSNMVAAARSMVAATEQHQQQHAQQDHKQHMPPRSVVDMADLHHHTAASPITESFIPDHLDHEKKRAQDARRATLTALSRQTLYAAGPPRPIAAACGTACSSGSSSCQGGTSCSSSSSSNQAGAPGDGEEVVTIHGCMRPDINCGHAVELEVVAASG